MVLMVRVLSYFGLSWKAVEVSEIFVAPVGVPLGVTIGASATTAVAGAPAFTVKMRIA
jgi:hypothetical protein